MYRALFAACAIVALAGCRCGAPPATGWDGGPRCTTRDDCPFGLACIDGVCAEPADPDGGGACTRDEDCTAGYLCVRSTGQCIADTTPDGGPLQDGGPSDGGACLDGETQSCGVSKIGECRFGTRTCAAGAFGPCSGNVDPVPEVCDFKDNDCDALLDEDFDQDRDRFTSCGGDCDDADAARNPGAAETCNGVDDDCDGKVDGEFDGDGDGFTTCGTRTAACCALVACAATGLVAACVDCDDTAAPVNPAATETCNGFDDDCDAATDEGLGSTTCGRGECERTVANCVGGASQTCTAGTPSTEVCDNKDNDCNGTTDDGVPDVILGQGACACTARCAAGTQTCTTGTPQPEICDGIDNNCDGRVDEGCTCTPTQTRACYTGSAGTQGVGECRPGTQTCDSAGQWGACAGEVVPAGESCDGKDNDCDTAVDEALGSSPCGVGECARTVANCAGGTPQTCTPGPSAAEACDNKDNDCNGTVDDMGTTSCGTGECQRTVPVCVAGVVQTCTPGSPTAEVCDAKDNDCNGTADDGLPPLTCGVGECARTVPACAGGAPNTCTPGPTSNEVCDGKDNDCDGTVDEGLWSNASTDLRITNDPASSDFVYIEWTGSRFGVAWEDRRNANNAEIYFVPLDAQGQRLGAQDVRITSNAGFSSYPALTWNGTAFGLVWADSTVDNREIWFQKLGADGTAQGAAVRVTNAPFNSDWPDVVWTGTGFGVAWEDERAGVAIDDIYFARLDANGVKQGADLRITVNDEDQRSPILKWNGTEFGLVWTDHRFGDFGAREIFFQRISATGTLLGSEVRVTNDGKDSAWPDLAWNGTEWAVVWHDDRDANYEIYLARISATGSKIGGDIRITSSGGSSTYPSIDWNGFQYGLSWQDNRGPAGTPYAIYYAGVSGLGVKNGADLKVSSGPAHSQFTTALWNGTQFAFGWKDSRDGPAGNTEVYFAYVGCPP